MSRHLTERDAVFVRVMREDLAYWIRRQPRTALRVIDLAEAVMRDPYTGIGKPEPLKHRGSDLWSRRVTDVDRLVYLVQAGRVVFLQARGHYTRT